MRYRVALDQVGSNVAYLTALCGGCIDGLELGDDVTVTRREDPTLSCEFCVDETRRTVTHG